MHALVTGGGGFLGGYIVEALRARGDRVRSFGRGIYPQLAAQGVEVVIVVRLVDNASKQVGVERGRARDQYHENDGNDIAPPGTRNIVDHQPPNQGGRAVRVREDLIDGRSEHFHVGRHPSNAPVPACVGIGFQAKSLPLCGVAHHQLVFPAQRMAYDSGEIVELWTPPQH